MYVALFVSMCLLGVCRGEEFVVDSDMDPGLTWMDCQTGRGLADWKSKTKYQSADWTVGRWKCVAGRGYVPKVGT